LPTEAEALELIQFLTDAGDHYAVQWLLRNLPVELKTEASMGAALEGKFPQ
jgi:hypothetical protein